MPEKTEKRVVYQLRAKGNLVNFAGSREERGPWVYATREAAEKRIDRLREYLERPGLMQLENVKVEVLELEVIELESLCNIVIAGEGDLNPTVAAVAARVLKEGL